MWVVVTVIAFAVIVYIAVAAPALRAALALPKWWALLAFSGVPMAFGGIAFAIRFWHPSAGPYVANRLYPFGSHLNAWAVSFGFMWLAFGLLFSVFTVQAARARTRQAWLALFAGWVLCWLPHGIIGIAFAWNGANRESVEIYASWADNPAGLFALLRGAFIMVSHFALSIAGFLGTGVEIWSTETHVYPSPPLRGPSPR